MLKNVSRQSMKGEGCTSWEKCLPPGFKVWSFHQEEYHNQWSKFKQVQMFQKINRILNKGQWSRSHLPKRNVDLQDPKPLEGQGHTYLREMLTSRIQGHWKVKVTPTWEKCWPPGSKAIERSRSHLPGRNVDLQDPRPLEGQGHTYLGEMLTSRIQGLRLSSRRISKPNSSWTQ